MLFDLKAWWVADPVPHLPETLRKAAPFSARPQSLLGVTSGYVASAGKARHPMPQAGVMRSGDIVTLELKADGDGVGLSVPAKARLRAATVDGLAMPVAEGRLFIACGTPDCATTHITLKLDSSEPFELMLVAFHHGLPPEGAKLSQARPSWAVPSQGGDRTLLVTKIRIPAR